MKKLAALSSLLLLAALPLAAQPAGPPAAAGPDQSENIIGPDYTPTPELAIPRGTVTQFTMASADSKIYPGIARIDNETMARRDQWGNRLPAPLEGNSRSQAYNRSVWVYVPAGYRAAGRGRGAASPPAPFMVVQDGGSYVGRMAPVLDTLIAEKKIPAIVVVFVNSGGSDAQNSQRGLEYDTMSGRYAEFIQSEVLPRVTAETGVAFTTDPEGRATAGCSSGAAAALSMAWYHPEWYHRVLSYSGTYVNQASPQSAATPRGAWEYHETLIPNAPRKPIRIWMEVAEKDLHFDDPEQSFHNWPMANKRMAAALKAKGYDYRFVYALGAGHCNAGVIAQTLPDALEWTWKGYPR
jgi:enterochelin esterase-like enzyme